MMKRFCITSIIICIVEFLLFAFICMDINPTMWPMDARIGYAVTITVGLFIYTVIYFGFD